jgi:hypothetical protein
VAEPGRTDHASHEKDEVDRELAKKGEDSDIRYSFDIASDGWRSKTHGAGSRHDFRGRRQIMNQEMRGRSNPRGSIRPFALACFIMLAAQGLPAHGRQLPQIEDPTVVGASLEGVNPSTALPPRSAAVAAVPLCAQVQHWDPKSRMCMPNGVTVKGVETEGVSFQRQETTTAIDAFPAEALPASSSCPSGQSRDPSMGMCMPDRAQSKTSLMFQLNQFMTYSKTSGPRGQSRLTGPGLVMLMYDTEVSPRNHFRIDVMGSPEQLTVGDKGTPQLLQTDHLDNMHAHDTIMALEFRDVVALGADDRQKLTFLFAPRGEAAIGPVPFMHRESAEGNPDAPLGHALQDGFHDASSVLGIEYRTGRTTLEATAFSGQTITRPFPTHRPDSYGLRVNQSFGDDVSLGASYADALLPLDAGGAEHNRFASAWMTTSHRLHGDSLTSAFIWGQGRAGRGAALNSFLEEGLYKHGRNHFYGRTELLQLTPDQLAIVPTNGVANAKWVEALTVGYERALVESGQLSLLVGASYTKDFIPVGFQPAYGSDPSGIKLDVTPVSHPAITRVLG